MGIMNTRFYWNYGVSNLSGTPPAAVVGTDLTANSSNVDGAQTQIIPAIAEDIQYLVVGMGQFNWSAEANHVLLDILVDPAGGSSYTSFIDNLVCGFSPTPTAGTVGISCWYHFPIFIKAGTTIGARARTANVGVNLTGKVVMYAFGNPNRPERWWCGQKVESLGINESSSKGTNITPGNSGADGSWTTIGTSTKRYGSVQFGVNGSSFEMTAIGYYWRMGFNSTQLPGSPIFYTSNSTAEIIARTGFVCPIWCDVPSGTTWQAMGTASGTAEVHDVAIYGVY